MRTFKLVKILMATSLTVIMTFTSCIKNEETDGVKALREAQAELIRAKAASETLMGQAEANYLNAQAALQNAQVEYQLAQVEYQNLLNAAKELSNAMQAAKDSMELERLKAQQEITLADIALQKANMMYALDIAEIEAEQSLMDAQLALEASKREYEKIMAQYAISNPALVEYMSEYNDKLDEIHNLKSEINSENFKLAKMKLYDEDDNSLAQKAFEKTRKETELASNKAWLAKYNAVSVDLSTKEAAKKDAEIELAEQNVSLSELNGEITAKQFDVDAALEAWNTALELTVDANDEYNKALELKDLVEFFEGDDLSGTRLISKEDINAVDRELVSVEAYYKSIAAYQEIIDNDGDIYSDEQVAEARVNKATVELVVAYYKTIVGGTTISNGVSAKKDAYFAAKRVSEQAEENYNSVGEEMEVLTDEKTALETNISQTERFINSLTGTIDVVKDQIAVKIKNLEDAIVMLEDAIAVIDLENTDWSNEIALQEVKIARLEAELATIEDEAAAIKALIDAEMGE